MQFFALLLKQPTWIGGGFQLQPKAASEPVYVSPFVGQARCRGDDGMAVVRNMTPVSRMSASVQAGV